MCAGWGFDGNCESLRPFGPEPLRTVTTGKSDVAPAGHNLTPKARLDSPRTQVDMSARRASWVSKMLYWMSLTWKAYPVTVPSSATASR